MPALKNAPIAAIAEHMRSFSKKNAALVNQGEKGERRQRYTKWHAT